MFALRLLLAFVVMSLAITVSANVVRSKCGVVKTARTNVDTYTSVAATIDGMARAHLAQSLRSDREYVGGVLRDEEGRYWATVGQGCRGQNSVTFTVAVPDGARLAAFWHTHGGPGRFRDFFSPDDVSLVRNTGQVFYLITPSGEMRVLHPEDVAAPGQRNTRRLDGTPQGAMVGRLVTFRRDSTLDIQPWRDARRDGACAVSAAGNV